MEGIWHGFYPHIALLQNDLKILGKERQGLFLGYRGHRGDRCYRGYRSYRYYRCYKKENMRFRFAFTPFWITFALR